MAMSDDESFVVLGSSPFPSFIVDKQQCSVASVVEEPTSDGGKKGKSDAIVTPQISLNKAESEELPTPNCLKPKRSIESDYVFSNRAGNSSLAASFILGEIDTDALKNSLYTQFPSLFSNAEYSEDIKKLQSLTIEYIELKSTLSKINSTMKYFLGIAQEWKTEVEKCHMEVACLRNENQTLKTEIKTTLDQIKIQDDLRQNEYDELRRVVSGKTAQIDNMSAEIDRLEHMQLTSFECIPKIENESKKNVDFVLRSEHERVIEELSELTAQNLDLRNVQKQYIDEINCLKVNLTAAEELIKQSRADISALTAENIEKKEILLSYENERTRIREHLACLQQQVEIYAKDFQLERVARENLASEKDQLLNDLRALQNKNQKLIESAEKRIETMENRLSSRDTGDKETKMEAKTTHATTSKPNIAPSDAFFCPICFMQTKSLSVLQDHVNLCLKD